MVSRYFSILAIGYVLSGAFCFVSAIASCLKKHLQSKANVDQSLTQPKNPDLPDWKAHQDEHMQTEGCQMEPLTGK